MQKDNERLDDVMKEVNESMAATPTPIEAAGIGMADYIGSFYQRLRTIYGMDSNEAFALSSNLLLYRNQQLENSFGRDFELAKLRLKSNGDGNA